MPFMSCMVHNYRMSGLNGTIGIEGKKLILSAGYGLGLAKLQSGTNNGEDNNNKHRVLSFTVGVKL
jgi:hypothetical protein